MQGGRVVWRNGSGWLAGSWDGTSLCSQGTPNAVGGNPTMTSGAGLPQDMEEPVVGATAGARSQQNPETRH